MTNMSGRPGCRTMEMNGGSSASVPLSASLLVCGSGMARVRLADLNGPKWTSLGQNGPLEAKMDQNGPFGPLWSRKCSNPVRNKVISTSLEHVL